MSYRVALERLRAYAPKMLTWGYYEVADGHCCAIGAVAPATRRCDTEGIVLLARHIPSVRDELIRLGMDEHEAFALQKVNDYFDGTPAERYAHVLSWLEAEVAKEPV